MLFRWWKKREEDDQFYKFFKNVLGFRPRNVKLYQIAFIHRSQSEADYAGHRVNNERLEYLGDAILDAVVADYLYRKYPNQGEGFLTETRSKIVSRASLGQIGRKIGLHDLINYNRRSQGVFKSIDGDAFEALVGAIYLEKGYDFTKRVVIERILQMYVDVDELTQTVVNYKGHMIDWSQKHRRKLEYRVLNTSSVCHGSRREYEVGLFLDGTEMARAVGYTIKSAEQLAAEKAYKQLPNSQ